MATPIGPSVSDLPLRVRKMAFWLRAYDGHPTLESPVSLGEARHIVNFLTSKYTAIGASRGKSRCWFPPEWKTDNENVRKAIQRFLAGTKCLSQSDTFITWKPKLRSLPDLPIEVILVIVQGLSLRDFNALIRTTRRLHSQLNGELYVSSKTVASNHALHWGFKHDMIATVQHVFDTGTDPLEQVPGEICPLYLAIQKESINVINHLVSKGGAAAHYLNTNIVETFVTRLQSVPQYPLHFIKPPSVEALLRMGADSNKLYNNRWTMLWFAIRGKCDVTVDKLFEIGRAAPVTTEFWEMQKKPIGQSEVATKNVGTLLKYGADPNGRSEGKITALHLACALCEPDVVKLLLKAGANPNARNSRNHTPLHTAAWTCGDEDLIDALLSAPAIKINAIDNFGQTALHFAARARCEPYAQGFVEKLLESPLIEANACDSSGRTALYCAVESKNFSVARRLLQSEKVNPNAGARDKLPLLLAVRRYDFDTVKLLLESGLVNPNQQTETGMTALLQAAKNGHVLMTKMLLRAGANPDLADRTGITARRVLIRPLIQVKLPLKGV
ncbi:hypothetical protein N7474_007925 [Penicillium riverlandense]|uniref:uncharacterized protein n=1 Tax=Penicillium riverlandense TaxID=1903569 RepID=UPI002549BEFA|nr:uncharacterized protein N7474_007925 [Penicillium riverlandense]KAJ5811624.1 hypothetical protein N7474_007925 [Penicillium riverlandense]